MDVMYKVGDRKVVRLMVMLLANLTQLDSGARSLLHVNIWEERRVFGSRAQGLKDLMLGSEPLPALELNKKCSRSGSVKIMRRDSRSIKTKLSIGGTAEKIVFALHTVLSKHPDEDTDLEKCKNAVRRLEKMEKDVEVACARVLGGNFIWDERDSEFVEGSASRFKRSRACSRRRGEEDVGDGEDLVGAVVGELRISVERSRACLVNWRSVGIQVQQATRSRARLEEGGGGGVEEGEGDGEEGGEEAEAEGAAPKGDEGGVELTEGHIAKEDPLDAR
ncbi:uncharacterized protein A4U43_C05F11340 [Asparagus officinalis]|uniref:Uncharacterized protein n=1 Tax=Asparagus officinalis TaxID=4686 RepID=A0A5P1EQY0_ASPOF|nr:uncharacterized protein A4U43_C05F11340 [Asparagus officinalis]